MSHSEDKAPDEAHQTRSRKAEHVDIILKEDVQARVNAWDDVTLVHEALPECDFDAIDFATEFLGKRLRAPLMIASMTGGYADAERINGNLAAAAADRGLAMGVGSQRAAVVDPSLRKTYSVVREHDVPFLAANIGAPQLVAQRKKPALTRAQISDVLSMLEADALIIHLNFLQEVVQPEGDLNAKGVKGAIRELSKDLGVPVIAKETGAGMRRASALRLKDQGVAGLDVGGLSGTTFAAVELVRARAEGATAAPQARLGEIYRDWGLPTPVSVVEAKVGLPLVATGGLRHGLDAARALALGADVAGFASKALRAANESAHATSAYFAAVELELRAACFLTGARRASDLGRAAVIVAGPSERWLKALGHRSEELGAARDRYVD
ncbi:MAG: type 2 isopentenyl-diphosphate Delta-isomerase [Thermoplasmatota archaeon]